MARTNSNRSLIKLSTDIIIKQLVHTNHFELDNATYDGVAAVINQLNDMVARFTNIQEGLKAARIAELEAMLNELKSK